MLDWGFCAYGIIDLAGQRQMFKGGMNSHGQGRDMVGKRCHLLLIDVSQVRSLNQISMVAGTLPSLEIYTSALQYAQAERMKLWL